MKIVLLQLLVYLLLFFHLLWWFSIPLLTPEEDQRSKALVFFIFFVCCHCRWVHFSGGVLFWTISKATLGQLQRDGVRCICEPSQVCLSIKLCVSDDPHLVSSKHKDVFEDILEDRRHSSDLRYSTRARDVPKFRLNKQRTPQQIKNHVLKSDRVQYAVEQVSVWICFDSVILGRSVSIIFMYHM